jgi:catechol 2,3-dioxygenase-like lactoylglutathione lyase family enzyme
MTTKIEARLDLIGIVSADLAASLDFYRLLGVDIPLGVQDEPHVEVELSSGLRLAWDTEATMRSFQPGWAGGRGGRVALAFLLPGPAEVDDAYRVLTAANGRGEVAPFDAFWGQRYAVLADPDGNPVELFAPLDSASS